MGGAGTAIGVEGVYPATEAPRRSGWSPYPPSTRLFPHLLYNNFPITPI